MSETLSTNQLVKEAQTAYKCKDYLSAAQIYQSAAASFSQIGADLTAAEMLNNASVAFLLADDAQTALLVLAGTQETFAAAGDTRRQALAVGNQAAALEGLSQLEAAVMAYQESADLLKDIGDFETRAQVMQSLSALQLRMGRQLEALATIQASMEGFDHLSTKQKLVKKLLHSPLNIAK